MVFWRKKNKVESPAPEKVIPSWRTLFSDRNRAKEQAKLAAAWGRSFQRTAKDMVIVDAAGAAHAMDDNQIQQAKIINSSMGFLPINILEWYSAQGFIGWQTCAVLAQQWLIDKAITMPAKDAVRHGWQVEANGGVKVDPKVFDELRKYDKKFRIKAQCIEFIKMGRTFGIRHALPMIDGIDYEAPFNPDGVMPGAYKGITQIDPYWLAPELDSISAANPAAPGFYEPTWWRVNGRRVHKSHFVIMRNGDQVPDILKPSYFYGGIPTPQKIFDRVYAAERTANEAPLLAMSKRLFSLKVDTTKAIADIETFQQEITQWTQMMNNFGVKVISGEEEVQQYDTSLQGLDETIMTQYQLVAAASGVPATKLLGTQPKGFNSSGDYEESSYHEELESLQENDLTALVDRHNLLVMRSYIAPMFKMAPINLEVQWNPVNSPTAEEQAEINSKKSATDAAWVNAGAIDGTDVRQRLIKDRDSGYTGIASIVPGGPGDREAEQEMKEAMLEQGEAEDGLETLHYDRERGTLEGARLVTYQKFLDENIVNEKIAAMDFTVNVTPEFEDEGKKYRMIIDGHHSLAAAVRMLVRPVFIESVPREVVMNAVTRQATDGKSET